MAYSNRQSLALATCSDSSQQPDSAARTVSAFELDVEAEPSVHEHFPPLDVGAADEGRCTQRRLARQQQMQRAVQLQWQQRARAMVTQMRTRCGTLGLQSRTIRMTPVQCSALRAD